MAMFNSYVELPEGKGSMDLSHLVEFEWNMNGNKYGNIMEIYWKYQFYYGILMGISWNMKRNKYGNIMEI